MDECDTCNNMSKYNHQHRTLRSEVALYANLRFPSALILRWTPKTDIWSCTDSRNRDLPWPEISLELSWEQEESHMLKKWGWDTLGRPRLVSKVPLVETRIAPRKHFGIGSYLEGHLWQDSSSVLWIWLVDQTGMEHDTKAYCSEHSFLRAFALSEEKRRRQLFKVFRYISFKLLVWSGVQQSQREGSWKRSMSFLTS